MRERGLLAMASYLRSYIESERCNLRQPPGTSCCYSATLRLTSRLLASLQAWPTCPRSCNDSSS